MKLNVFFLEEGLKELAHKFGNISSNRKDISIFILMLEELRFSMGRSVVSHFMLVSFACYTLENKYLCGNVTFFVPFLYPQEPAMNDFECHYRIERWPTAQYFDFVKDFLIAAQQREDSDDCDPPPCPTSPYTVTGQYTPGAYFRVIHCATSPSC